MSTPKSILETPSYLQHSQCTEPQKKAADMVKELHDQLEVVSYRAFTDIIKQLEITENRITFEQSGQILSHVKSEAHVELYREGGYWKSRLALLDQDGSQVALLVKEQFQKQVNGLARLIHDRDIKLTDARYHSLTDMAMSFDDHNYMVKENLLRSWYKCPNKDHGPSREILDETKRKAQFYESLRGRLNFDLQNSLKKREAFFDKFFPNLRDPEMGKEFMNVLAVRDFFGEDLVRFNPATHTLFVRTPNSSYKIDTSCSNAQLIDILHKQDSQDLFDPQTVTNSVRRSSCLRQALLEDRSITIGQLLERYFPEIKQEKASIRLSSAEPSCFSRRTVVLITVMALVTLVTWANQSSR